MNPIQRMRHEQEQAEALAKLKKPELLKKAQDLQRFNGWKSDLIIGLEGCIGTLLGQTGYDTEQAREIIRYLKSNGLGKDYPND